MMQATLHQLKVFEAVARHSSFTKAAEELMITQPTVSTQVKQLTQTIGLPLFEQIGKQLYLTEAGEALLSTCQNIFEQLDNLEMQVASLKGTKQGRLRLGVVSTAKYFVPRVLGHFCQQYPGIDIALQVTNHATLIQRMQDNQDDLYILSQPPEDLALSSQPFLDNPLVVVSRQDHPLAGEKNIPIKSLAGEPFIMREQGSGTRQSVQKLFERYKVGVKVRLELGSNEAIKQAIAGGLGLSVLSQHTLIAEQLMGELTILDVQHFPIHLRWYVTHLEGKQLSIIAETFLKFLLENSNHVPLLGTLALQSGTLLGNHQVDLVKLG
ncbi:LysR family transcriptional regulator [Planktothrix mougeotii]|uniref:LysR family transcriptional regulator n=1 Tax=Planktothrix mougeotii LEGE 06226 TaxID=1828728 RepID=A0ABR9U909_9CYAN|nr:LysR family transcriptional regulator [Planktothrix mougeotii]MBE9142942.1 LysR family transcriptional regulator [Planktothrix mougeotii LEGE 06226]